MTRCHLSDLDVDQCACRVHVRGEDAEPRRRAFYDDDAQVVRLIVVKRYAATSGAQIAVTQL